jgi:hypothetical protein
LEKVLPTESYHQSRVLLHTWSSWDLWWKRFVTFHYPELIVKKHVFSMGFMKEMLTEFSSSIVFQVSLPSFSLGLPAYYILASSEASSNLSRYDGIR